MTQLVNASALGASLGAEGEHVGRVQDYLSRFGWLNITGRETSWSDGVEAPQAAHGEFDRATQSGLSDFQRFYRLPVTGVLDAPTLALMSQPRCGVPDRLAQPLNGMTAEAVKSGSSWSKRSIGWQLTTGTDDLSDASVRAAIWRAYRSWCLHANIAVAEVLSGAEIDVRFVTGDHGDGYSFDGPGHVSGSDWRNTLAHGFYPPPAGGRFAGDMHFDDYETWTRDLPPTGTDLDCVSLHEAGHTLGLDHSGIASAVMFAFYPQPRVLSGDDIAGIRDIYGARSRNRWNHIDGALEGAATYAGKVYLFHGGVYVRYDYASDLPDVGYAKKISGNWPGLTFTGGFDDAVNGQAQFSGKAYFFKGDQYARYDWTRDRTDPGYPRPIRGNWTGLPEDFTSGIDAAVSGEGPFAGKLYLFKGARYLRYDWAKDRMDAGYPQPIKGLWRGLPGSFSAGVQAAANGQKQFGGKLYFFKDGQYARYDWAKDRMDTGYPQPIDFNWL